MDASETLKKENATRALTKHKYVDVIIIFILALIFTIMLLFSEGII